MPDDTNISLFLPSLRGGGAEKCIVTLAKGLCENGLDVSLVLGKAEGPYLNQVPKKVRLIDLGIGNVWRGLPKLAQYLKKAKPDVLLSALDYANINILLAKQVSGAAIRVAVSTHAMLSIEAKESSHLTWKAMPALVRHLYPLADSIIAVSKAVATDISNVTRLPPEKIHVIYNPVATREIATMSRAPIKVPWLDQEDSPVVLAVGSLWPHKDHATLIRAVSLAMRSQSLRLVILGEGPERERLHELARKLGLDKVVFMPGFVSNPYSWMARSSVFVLPSLWEGLPTVLIEAMACGITPVATDCPGGSAEILENGQYGVLSPVGNPSALARAICKSLESPRSPEALRKRASVFSVENAVQRYMEVVVKGGNPSQTG